ncbi:MAG: SPASM domain-containing protein [Methanobrevibacter sp.]|jgi:radical SAM protein with 4Fe4S-binding SPASM domain|nr:SPASM domain-containing protein [Candidatus Methanovirga meridionalis]
MYIPHESIIFTNDLEEFKANKVLKVYDSFIKDDLKYPYEIEIHLTGNCPSKCKECSYASRHTGDVIGLDKIEDIFSLLSTHTHNVHTIFFSGGGDPFAYPYWKELLELHDKYIPNVNIGVSTSLLILPDIDFNKISYFQIHFSGFNSESYIDQIGFDAFNRFYSNLMRVEKSNVDYVLKLLFNQYVNDNLTKFLDFLVDLNPKNIIFKCEQDFLHNRDVNHSINEEYTFNIIKKHLISKKYKTVLNNLNDDIFKDNTEVDMCHIVKKGLYCLIREDGNVYPCIASTNMKSNSLGNINDNSFDFILKNKGDLTKFDNNMLSELCPLKACRHYRFNKIIEKEYDENNDYNIIHSPDLI